jgi:C4-dicarboxylate-specific signal transduction histidine kinase
VSAEVVTWPAALAQLRHGFALDEVASTLRHTTLNDLAGMGALLFRLRRRIDAMPALATDAEVARVLDGLDARIAAAPAKLAVRFMAEPAQRARTHLGAAIRELVTTMAPAVAMDVAAGEIWAGIDAGELGVALGCLLENAVEAVSAAGTGTIAVRCTSAQGRVTLEVSDDAEPIDPERADHFFDPFFTTRAGHAGLGLKIARGIVHRWEGELLVNPRAPRGLGVAIQLPLLQAPQTRASGSSL